MTSRQKRIARFSAELMEALSEDIKHNPQGHVDWLVKTGVLRCDDHLRRFYRVVEPEPPHVHDWYVGAVSSSKDHITLACRDPQCFQGAYIPNRLPIEVPGD